MRRRRITRARAAEPKAELDAERAKVEAARRRRRGQYDAAAASTMRNKVDEVAASLAAVEEAVKAHAAGVA